MELRLDGHFSYIDQYNKLKFTFLDEDATTREKLINHCMPREDNVHKPFTASDFTITMQRGMRITDDIRMLVGLDCSVYVRLKPYSFVSKLDKNRGEKVQGIQLVLTNINRLA